MRSEWISRTGTFIDTPTGVVVGDVETRESCESCDKSRFSSLFMIHIIMKYFSGNNYLHKIGNERKWSKT